ncbi:Acyl-CoA synthetase (AMP-forming)/AMP-acid ligase II [Frankia sp. AiPs1]|uniref:class I adenylate-forming enzyme family protein n=1 Tax=Frankia sp. AiPa1 TaxID=573492 RepID=UPI00202B62FD|nr:class I adenylate-forming enzyme family protein [Frankia sp. AiPa1]MCL9762672.1 acyl--CoA ligase [Frankia sp. AiPa1]
MADRPVLAFEDRSYGRAELDALTEGMARRLAGRGVRPGDRVALMSSNRPEFVIAIRALWRLGASAVLFSPAWRAGEVEYALGLTEPRHAVGDHEALAAVLPMLHLDEPIEPIEPVLPAGPGPGVDRGGAAGVGPVGAEVWPAPPPDAEALLVFSSGTTGLPKAVRHTHATFGAAVGQWRRALGMSGADRMQIATPPSHILGILNIITVLESGAWMRLHRRFDLDQVLRGIERDRVTIEMAVAPIALAMAAHPDLESFDLSSLRYIMWCATPVTPSVAESVTARTGVGWVTGYGSSEVPVFTCSPFAADELRGSPLDSVGRVVDGVELRVVDPDSGVVLPDGAIGEIQARSASAMVGYLPPEATAQAFQDDWYRTGDIGQVDADGWVRLTDRRKEMIKVRAFQVAPAEVETVLHSHPAVIDCAVFGVADDADGERVVAAVATRAPVEADELVALVGGRLASYKRPRHVLFVDEIPRLPSGKVLRRVLRARYEEVDARETAP